MKPAPIAFFCFNRADKTRLVLEALKNNEAAKESEIYIFCDGPRNIKDLAQIREVHNVIDHLHGFRKINCVKREINHGLQHSIISGINSVLENNDSVIVLEDDIITAKNFLKFLNQALEFYKSEQNIWCVTGFNYPSHLISYPKNYAEDIFFVHDKNCSWGWGTWKDRWQKIDFEIRDFPHFIKNKKLTAAFNRSAGNMSEMLRFQKEGKISSWAIQMSYAMFKNNGYSLHPVKTLVKNIGFDASATHTNCRLNLTDFEFEACGDFKLKKLSEIADNFLAEKPYIKFHRDSFFLVKWFKSKKKRRKLKWLFFGIIIAEIINFLFKI
jgi:hypothetical protein